VRRPRIRSSLSLRCSNSTVYFARARARSDAPGRGRNWKVSRMSRTRNSSGSSVRGSIRAGSPVAGGTTASPW
jgi:hypothetical protein